MIEPIIEKSHPHDSNGIQRLYRFPNGYGASVVRFRMNLYDIDPIADIGFKLASVAGMTQGPDGGSGSYGYNQGLWELAVIKWDGDDFDLVYTSPITDDVIGSLNEGEVQEILEKIEKFQKNQYGAGH
jgi:hypothetical protein